MGQQINLEEMNLINFQAELAEFPLKPKTQK